MGCVGVIRGARVGWGAKIAARGVVIGLVAGVRVLGVGAPARACRDRVGGQRDQFASSLRAGRARGALDAQAALFERDSGAMSIGAECFSQRILNHWDAAAKPLNAHEDIAVDRRELEVLWELHKRRSRAGPQLAQDRKSVV